MSTCYMNRTNIARHQDFPVPSDKYTKDMRVFYTDYKVSSISR